MDSDSHFDVHSDAHSFHSTLSTSSSIPDLQERGDKTVGPTTATPPPLQSSLMVKIPEPGDFSLRATGFVSTPDASSRNDWVRLNVGGKIFATTRLVQG